MLQNAYLLAKIGADTAENDQNFAEILPKTGNYPTGSARRAFAAAAASASDGSPNRGPGRAGSLYNGSVGQTWQGSFSAVSRPNFATKYAFESSRRDLHNALFCTAL